MARSFKTPITVDGSISTNNVIASTNSIGDEGGQIDLTKSETNTTLTTGVTIDVFRNQLRFFETGGTNRGYYLDISTGGTSATTNIIGTASSVSATVTGTSTTELVRGNMADNDYFRILVGGTASNAGYVELATADDGTEPIYVRQYTGVFATLTRTATILDGSGNTSFPGAVTATSFNSITGLSSTTPSASGTAAVGTATTAARADHVHPTTGLGLTSGTLAQFAATTSAQLLGVISDETGSGALVFGTTPTITPADAVAATSATTAGFMGMPQNAKTASYTLVASDAGKHIYFSGTTASQIITIPANGSVAYQIGTTITFINLASVSVSIAITTDTMYLAGPGTTGTRTLAAYGMATAVKITSTSWIISGNGLT
jgi:hypothetical protein